MEYELDEQVQKTSCMWAAAHGICAWQDFAGGACPL